MVRAIPQVQYLLSRTYPGEHRHVETCPTPPPAPPCLRPVRHTQTRQVNTSDDHAYSSRAGEMTRAFIAL